MGAWIETTTNSASGLSTAVAPYVGAWIETEDDSASFISIKSHPTWVRGLKRVRVYELRAYGVAPYVGAWIETFNNSSYLGKIQSHPTWVRGLKLVYLLMMSVFLSRTLRGCVD